MRARFGEIAERHPQAGTLIGRLRRISEVKKDRFDIEGELDRIFEQEASNPNISPQLASFRFYVRDVIAETADAWLGHARGFTNYRALIDHLAAWRYPRGDEPVFLVTFNYDTMLERAVSEVLGHQINGLDDYVGPADWKWPIFKLHGSVDWGRFVEPSELVRTDVDQARRTARSAVRREKGIRVGSTRNRSDTTRGTERKPAASNKHETRRRPPGSRVRRIHPSGSRSY